MSKVWDFVKGIAPTLAGLAVGGPFAPVASMMVAKAVGTDDNTEAGIQAAIDQMGPDKAAAAIQSVENEKADELAIMAAENARLQMQETHKTAREEIVSKDEYVRRWRPAFGYAVKDCFILQVGGTTLVVMFAVFAEIAGGIENGGTVEIIKALGAMIGATTIIWGFAMSVLGVNIHSRSQDKAIAAGQDISKQPGMIGSLIKKFTQ